MVCYELTVKASRVTWLEADAECVSRGGNLVSISTRDEADFVHKRLMSISFDEDDQDVYIGEKGRNYRIFMTEYE